MNNTLRENIKIEQVFKKLSQVGLLKILEKKLDSIFFIGDSDTLHYLRDNLPLETTTSKLEYFEFDVTTPEESLDKVNQIKHSISQDIIIIASIEHERNIYERLARELRQTILLLFDDIFVNLVIKRKALAPIPVNFATPKTSYCILSTPRSGSTMLCDALISTKLAGFPKEHLREPSLILAEHCNFSTDRYLKAVMSLHVTDNSVFGTKLISHFIEKYSKLSDCDFDPLSYFSKFVYLIRKDKIAQAVSLFLAQKSGIWHIDESQKLSKYQNEIDNEFINNCDLDKVHFLHNRLLEEEQFLEAMFQQHNLEPLTIYYEDLVLDLSSNISSILRYINIFDSSNIDKLDMSVNKKKLSSKLSNKVIEMYKNKFSC